MSFIFGGDTGLTYDQLKRKREIADALRANASRAPRDIGEGLSSIGQALIVRSMDKKADKAEAEGRKRSDELWGALFGNAGIQTPYSQSTPAAPEPRTPEQEIGDDAMAAIGKPEAMSIEGKILNGLQNRGLPEHVAQGFVQNFRDESGLKTDINETSPLVPGSRGGYGLAQWTGPRRKQLEAFAAAQGKPVSDLDLQLDFLVSELQGSESAAGRTILSTRSTPEAATAIVNDFLRPAEQHRASRAAKYGGQSTGPSGGNNMAQIVQAMSDPYIARDPARMAVVSALLQQNMQANDPLRQMQLERGRLELDQLRNPQPKMTDDIREFQFGLQNPEFNQWMQDNKKAGAPNVSTTVNTASAPDARPLVDKPEKAYQRRWDPENGTWVDEAIPGSAAAREVAEEQAAAAARESAADTSSDVVTTAATRARDAVSKQNFGSAGTTLIGKLPWTDSAEVVRQTDAIKSMAAAENLNAMRRQSKTGGALGNVTEKELKLLQDKSGALDPNSPTFLRDLDDYERTLLRTIHGHDEGDRIFAATRGGVGASAPDPNVTPQISAEDQEFLKSLGLN